MDVSMNQREVPLRMVAVSRISLAVLTGYRIIADGLFLPARNYQKSYIFKY